MTRGGMREYLEALQGRYLRGRTKGEGHMLGEADRVTCRRCKAHMRSLRDRLL